MAAATTEWIIGRGLLGSAIAQQLGHDAYAAQVRWEDPELAVEDLRTSLSAFLAQAPSSWAILWTAGRGVTSSTHDQLDVEARVFHAFLDLLREYPETRLDGGRIFLASSVGGAYAGSTAPPFTELTPTAPLSAYGEVKLEMEDSLRSLVAATALRGLIARITNLYGPGQDLGKGQGLISVIVESYVTGRPVSIYVPLDTLRDYIYVDDCARIVVAGVDRLARETSGTVVTKIIGSMGALSVGAIVGEISRLRRKPVPIVTGQGNSTGQSGDLRVRSIVWPDLDALASTTMPAGLGATYRAQLAQHILPSHT